MMSGSAIIIGKGPSILRTTSEYVSSFDDIIIVNRPVWDGYEKHIPRKADIQYRNKSTEDFSKEEMAELGLRKVVSIAQVGEQFSEGAHYGIIEVEYPPFQAGPDNHIILNYKDISFSPSGGVLAFHHIVESGEYDKISVVGLDLMMLRKRAYYFEPEEMQDNAKYLLYNGTYSREGFVRTEKALHSEENAIVYMTGVIEEKADIRFDITSDNEKLIGLIEDLPNTTIL
jgi:hypothetical protein